MSIVKENKFWIISETYSNSIWSSMERKVLNPNKIFLWEVKQTLEWDSIIKYGYKKMLEINYEYFNIKNKRKHALGLAKKNKNLEEWKSMSLAGSLKAFTIYWFSIVVYIFIIFLKKYMIFKYNMSFYDFLFKLFSNLLVWFKQASRKNLRNVKK